MEDQAIIDMYFERDELAIDATRDKYGRLLRSVAYGILRNHEDSEECENDTYLKAWNVMPPQRPAFLQAFLAKITRNLSLDLYEKNHAAKRGGGQVPLILDELTECIPDNNSLSSSEDADEEQLMLIINSFLAALTDDARKIFMRRYFFGDSVNEISYKLGFGKSKVKMSLLRSRDSLKARLKEEGYYG